jgi:hypothetical protein
MHTMKRHAIALAVLVVLLMQEFNILNFDREINLEEL